MTPTGFVLIAEGNNEMDKGLQEFLSILAGSKRNPENQKAIVQRFQRWHMKQLFLAHEHGTRVAWAMSSNVHNGERSYQTGGPENFNDANPGYSNPFENPEHLW